jgi:hypothetical protein
MSLGAGTNGIRKIAQFAWKEGQRSKHALVTNTVEEVYVGRKGVNMREKGVEAKKRKNGANMNAFSCPFMLLFDYHHPNRSLLFA